MDFFVGLPHTPHRDNAILVALDKLTKITHFLLFKHTYDIVDVARVFINEIIDFHRFPKNII